MTPPLSACLQWLGQHAWLHKSARTLLAVAPGLIFFVNTGEPRGVMFAFAALCLSVPYGDHSFRPVHLAGCAVAGVAHVLVSRSAILPPRVPTWVLIYLLYESSELHGAA